MESIQVTAKTIEEAIELALKELDANREEVEIEIVSRGKTGILGIGGEPAKVKVARLVDPSETVLIAQEVIKNILSKLNVIATIHIRPPSEEEEDRTHFEIEGDDAGLLIGRRGETLQSFQFLVNFILRRRLKEYASIILDVEGYKERRNATLKSLALRMAERAIRYSNSVTLDPMSPSERRIVHIALSNHTKVSTESIGDGSDRRVTINLKA